MEDFYPKLAVPEMGKFTQKRTRGDSHKAPDSMLMGDGEPKTLNSHMPSFPMLDTQILSVL